MIEPAKILILENHAVNKYLQRFKTVEARFWEKVDKTSSPHGCWLWAAGCDGHEYGVFFVDGRQVKASRFSWMLHYGEIPDGLLVLHDCPGGDNPRCVCPFHLWLGTSDNNSKDMVEKGRQARGETHGTRTHPEALLKGVKNGCAKLNDDIVRAMRIAYANGNITFDQLGKLNNVSKKTARFAVLGKTWGHI